MGKLQLLMGANKENPVKNCSFEFGDSSASDLLIIGMFENDTSFSCGDDCMFSHGIIIRCSDGHAVMNSDGEIINRGKSVKIGNHVWVGQDALISKNTQIPDGCIVGARAVVTKKFEQKNCIIAGVPAKIVKEDIQWDRRLPDRIF